MQSIKKVLSQAPQKLNFALKFRFSNNNSITTLDYTDLIENKDLSKQIGQAYGYEGLGILTVKNIPEYEKLRGKLLPLARKFAELPEDVKEFYTDPSNYYQFGWSHGKELFNGKPDFAKGSYYANPVTDEQILRQEEEKFEKYMAFRGQNIWPSKEIPEFREAFLNMTALMIRVGSLVGRQCDNFQKIQTGEQGDLESVVLNSNTHKARLLHYFPVQQEQLQSKNINKEVWCGWHNDTGSLTGLCAEMFIDGDNNVVNECPDPEAGLYIQSRSGEQVHVRLPSNQMGFQIGESAQIKSGGVLIATPHMVKSAKVPKMTRETIAIFMQPSYNQSMRIPQGRDEKSVYEPSKREFLPAGIPQIEDRYAQNYDFGQFLTETIKLYH